MIHPNCQRDEAGEFVEVIVGQKQIFAVNAMLEPDIIPKFDFQPESVSGKAVLITGGTTGI